MKAAVVVSTYNQPRLLGLCLESLCHQRSAKFDVFIADDGSTVETEEKIKTFENRINISHFWHEDQGYYKSKINNEVFKNLNSYDVVICIDHDVILHPLFVNDHLMMHRKNEHLLFMGRRVDLAEQVSRQIHENDIERIFSGFYLPLWKSFLIGETRNWLRSIRLSAAWFRQVLGRDQVDDLLGSNFSVSREMLFKVNGYNEDYRSYWGEDGDLFIRLRNAGAVIKGSKSIALQYHLYHPRLEPDPENEKRYQTLLDRYDYIRCENGIF